MNAASTWWLNLTFPLTTLARLSNHLERYVWTNKMIEMGSKWIDRGIHCSILKYTHLHLGRNLVTVANVVFYYLRPKAKDLGITRVVVLGFFVWSMPYKLSPPQFFKYFKSFYPSSSICICQSINQPLPFPKCQYIIAADLVSVVLLLGANFIFAKNLSCVDNFLMH